jgi:hypothetical protein
LSRAFDPNFEGSRNRQPSASFGGISSKSIVNSAPFQLAVQQMFNVVDYPVYFLGVSLPAFWFSAWVGSWRARRGHLGEEARNFFAILLGAALTLLNLLIGYDVPERNAFFLLILPIALSISLFLIADIDSPRRGIIRVQPQNLESLAESLHSQ